MRHLFANYARFDVAFVHGQGCYLFDEQQKAYLDFATGIAVSSLGHQHPALIKAIQEQSQRVWHVSNLYRIPQQERLAELLCQHSFADRVLFCNSGLEANEAALKLVRRYHAQQGQSERYRFLVIDGAFHGRSMAQIGASSESKMTDGFAPLPDWFDMVAADDLALVETAINAHTAAIILEPIQGDGGGVHFFAPEYLQGLRRLCDQHGLLLVLDEIQCGNGRTGRLWCYEHSSIMPDIMTTAKGLGGGFPIGAVMSKEYVAVAMEPGTHGTTFGGNPLACAVGVAVMETLTSAGFLGHVTQVGDYFARELEQLAQEFPDIIVQIRGKGLMRGLRCQADIPALALVKAALAEGLLLVPAGRNVVRLLPPLVVSEQEIDTAINHLAAALKKLRI